MRDNLPLTKTTTKTSVKSNTQNLNDKAPKLR